MRQTSIKDFETYFENLNLSKGDNLFIHSSLLRFGKIEGGLKALIKILEKLTMNDITIAMPSFTWNFSQKKIWDYKLSKSDVGALTEHFRHIPFSLRSIHPIHSIIANGKNAKFVCDHNSQSSFGKESSFSKMIDLKFKNISLGTDFIGGATFLHKAEEKCKVPYRKYINLNGDIFLKDKTLIKSDFTYFSRCKDVVFNWQKLYTHLIEKGLISVKTINNVKILDMNMGKVNLEFETILAQDPEYIIKG